jgi:hypothetical protein
VEWSGGSFLSWAVGVGERLTLIAVGKVEADIELAELEIHCRPREPQHFANPQSCERCEIALRRRSVQSQADSGLPTQLIPVAFRRVNHTFLYLYPRDA